MSTRIIVTIDGGVVTCISCSDPTADCSVLDLDDFACGESTQEDEAIQCEAEALPTVY